MRVRAVLVVDDDFDIRETLREVLVEEGYRVDTARDGREALAYLKSHPPPCVILLDLMMPGMNGAEFRRAQRADPALLQIPVVAISASRDLAAFAGELDDVEHLPKPIQLDVLLDTIARYSQQARALP